MTPLPPSPPASHPAAKPRSDAGADVEFVFEGRRITARAGDTVAAALLRSGVRVFSRSSRYHRPRGYRCGQGHCSACAMRVDGLPGVRTCVTPARPGMTVEREHAWPAADRDVLRAAELLAPFMPPGFYYRRFTRSPGAFRVFERMLAWAAGQGGLPSPQAAARAAAVRARREDPDVLVVGGGVAGMSAALAAADSGAAVLLVDQDDRLGGLLGEAPPAPALAARVAAHPGVEVLTSAEAVGWYEEGVVAVDRRPDLLLVQPKAVVVATGGYDAGLPFAGWDLPGVMLATGALRLVERHGVSPGSRAVVVTTGDHGHRVASRLHVAGVEVACVADCRPPQAVRSEVRDETRATGAAIVAGARGARAHGRTGVRAVSVLPARGAATDPCGRRATRFAADLVVVAAGIRPADDLAYQATSRGSLVLAVGDGADAGLRLAGLVIGTRTADEAVAQGAAAPA